MSNFQKQVNTQPAPAMAGDFADGNPRAFLAAGPGALVADPTNGVTVGLFAWVTNDASGAPASIANASTGTTAPDGFVHREQLAQVSVYLDGASQVIPKGQAAELAIRGDYWVKNETGGAVTVGQAVFTATANGKFTATAAGAGLGDSGFVVKSPGANNELVKIARQ